MSDKNPCLLSLSKHEDPFFNSLLNFELSIGTGLSPSTRRAYPEARAKARIIQLRRFEYER